MPQIYRTGAGAPRHGGEAPGQASRHLGERHEGDELWLL